MEEWQYMYRIGYLDDEREIINDYKKRLQRRDIELLIAPSGCTMPEVKKWIVRENIKCMLVDYQLSIEYDFNGTELISYLNDELPGLPCIILTSYREDSVEENLVLSKCIVDRDLMADNEKEFSQFCADLVQATQVYENNLKKYTEKYVHLLEKKKSGTITNKEEEEFFTVFRILKAYGEVDDLPEPLLKSEVSCQIDELLKKLDVFLEQK